MTAPVVPEIDFDLESRLVRIIRRRFLWMCGVRICLGLLIVVSFLTRLETDDRHSPGGWRRWCFSLLDLSLVIGAGAYVWRSPLDRRRLMRLIFLLAVAGGLIDVVGTRFAFLFELRDNDSAASFLRSALPLISYGYLFASLFIRWSVREALSLAATLLAITLVVAATCLQGQTGASPVKLVLLSPLWFLPGVLICWWSHSRLLAKFRSQFETTQYRRFQTELTSARKLHDALLPRQVTDGPVRLSYTYEPMREIGGDLIYLYKDKRPEAVPSSMIVLDVTGHGIAAALTVNRLVGEIERLFGEDAAISPRQLIGALDRYISLTLAHHGIFATACCAKFSCESNRLEWYSGGHPPAFICRGNGSLERLESTGPLLGIDYDSFDGEERQTRFDPGDVLVCYTDGAIEAMNADGTMVGIDGVEMMLTRCATDRLPPRDWPAAVLSGVLDHRRAPAADDTLIAAFYCPGTE